MAKSYGHLDQQERALIETQLRFGMRPAAIAVGLMRARSTITREMWRNGWQPSPARTRPSAQKIAGGYRCVSADRRARLLAVKPRVQRKLIAGNQLWITVVDHLRQGLSPTQIASTLARMPDPVRLSYETIYTALYTMPRGHLRARPDAPPGTAPEGRSVAKRGAANRPSPI
jgi:IS30 family transposase